MSDFPIVLLPTQIYGAYITRANPTGGKAGKGHNITSTIQVFRDRRLVKQVRYNTQDIESYRAAVKKAVAFAKETQ